MLLEPSFGADVPLLRPGKGSDLVGAKCKTCHEIAVVTNSAGISPAAWEQVMRDMEEFGLQLESGERATILRYLASSLGPYPPSADDPEKADEDGPPSGGRQAGK